MYFFLDFYFVELSTSRELLLAHSGGALTADQLLPSAVATGWPQGHPPTQKETTKDNKDQPLAC